jgi:protein TonB
MAYFFEMFRNNIMVRIYTNKIQYFLLVSLCLHILFFITLSSFAYLTRDQKVLDVFLISDIFVPVKESSKASKIFTNKQKKQNENIVVKKEVSEPLKSVPSLKAEPIDNTQIEQTGKTYNAPISSSAVGSRTSEVASSSHGNGGNRILDTEFGNVNGPKFIYRETPVYPQIARRLGKEGRVVLRLTISEKGELLNIEVIEAAPYGFVDSAIEAVKKSKFQPASKDGKPVACRAILPVKFVLK